MCVGAFFLNEFIHFEEREPRFISINERRAQARKSDHFVSLIADFACRREGAVRRRGRASRRRPASKDGINLRFLRATRISVSLPVSDLATIEGVLKSHRTRANRSSYRSSKFSTRVSTTLKIQHGIPNRYCRWTLPLARAERTTVARAIRRAGASLLVKRVGNSRPKLLSLPSFVLAPNAWRQASYLLMPRNYFKQYDMGICILRASDPRTMAIGERLCISSNVTFGVFPADLPTP